MRVTVDLPQDLYAQVVAISGRTRRTPSDVVACLMRRGSGQGRTPEVVISARTSFPVVHLGRTITVADLRELRDEP